MKRSNYIIQYSKDVIAAVRNTRLFPSVMMAQALIESADRNGVPGGSLLARKYNNHFGIKADASWKGEKVELPTKEFINGVMRMVKAWFRAYQHARQSFEDRVRFLVQNRRYQRGGVFDARNAGEQAHALQRSGYATDPLYATKLIAIIKRHGLEQLDNIGVNDNQQNHN